MNYLWLNVCLLFAILLEPLDVDLAIEVTDVANNSVILHGLKMIVFLGEFAAYSHLLKMIVFLGEFAAYSHLLKVSFFNNHITVTSQ